ncbi:MAG TPA: tetratricopeptide repeat protein [Methylomirabilota bacterium]|nr:tetratricopeptide repeat protein [Methylomirabilota bacterium]
MIALPRLSWRLVAVAGGGVVLVAALAVGLWLWSDTQQRRATAAHAAALARLGQTRSREAGEARAAAVRDLEAVLASHPSSPLAAQTALEIGNARYAERDWARARGAWAVAAGQARAPTVRTLAREGIGYAWEGERDWARAAEAFQAALADLKPGDFHYEELLIDLARVQELGGQKVAAIETYRRLLKEVPGSLRADDVRTRLASLGAAP